MKLNADQKRKLIWTLLAICVVGLVSGLYFPPSLIITFVSLLGAGGAFLSFDTEVSDKITELSDKITKYETPVDLQALISESFPKEAELQRLVPPNKKDDSKENKEKVANDMYAQHVFFSGLQTNRDNKKEDRDNSLSTSQNKPSPTPSPSSNSKD